MAASHPPRPWLQSIAVATRPRHQHSPASPARGKKMIQFHPSLLFAAPLPPHPPPSRSHRFFAAITDSLQRSRVTGAAAWPTSRPTLRSRLQLPGAVSHRPSSTPHPPLPHIPLLLPGWAQGRKIHIAGARMHAAEPASLNQPNSPLAVWIWTSLHFTSRVTSHDSRYSTRYSTGMLAP